MKILVSFFLLSFSAFPACHFKDQKVYSLSGSATKVIEELGLIHHLKGVSVFYPEVKGFKGEIIPGGIFLSPSQLSRMEGSVVFYDRSQELRKTFTRMKLRSIEINDRNKTPSEVVGYLKGLVAPFVADCDFRPVTDKAEALEKKIVNQMKEKWKIIFFLGEVGAGKLPELVIAHDGLILWLKRMSLVSTYPSELAYVNWSGAILESMKKDHLLLGLKEGKTPAIKGDRFRATFTHPGILTPGLHQLEAWSWFVEHSQLGKGR